MGSFSASVVTRPSLRGKLFSDMQRSIWTCPILVLPATKFSEPGTHLESTTQGSTLMKLCLLGQWNKGNILCPNILMACMKIRLKRKFDRGKLRHRGVQGTSVDLHDWIGMSIEHLARAVSTTVLGNLDLIGLRGSTSPGWFWSNPWYKFHLLCSRHVHCFYEAILIRQFILEIWTPWSRRLWEGTKSLASFVVSPVENFSRQSRVLNDTLRFTSVSPTTVLSVTRSSTLGTLWPPTIPSSIPMRWPHLGPWSWSRFLFSTHPMEWQISWIVFPLAMKVEDHSKMFDYYSHEHHTAPFRSERRAWGHDTERGGWAILLFGMWKEYGW